MFLNFSKLLNLLLIPLCLYEIVKVLKSYGIDLLSYIKPILGNGANTSFWNVPWRGEMALKDLAPRIYMLESMKGISVKEKLEHGSLLLSLRRHPRGGVEQQQMDMIQEITDGCSLSNSMDRWSWCLDGVGEFTVASVRRVIDDNMLPSSNSKTRWIKEVPIKINIHAWKVKNDYLPTQFNMSRRGMDIESILCPLCNDMAESSSHLFFSCMFTRAIMRKIHRWWELDSRDFTPYEDWLDWMGTIRFSIIKKRLLEGIYYIGWWFIWMWRNKGIFGQESSLNSNIFDEIVSRSFIWVNSRCKSKFSWIDWLKNPKLITL